jgi:hypothetical protein
MIDELQSCENAYRRDEINHHAWHDALVPVELAVNCNDLETERGECSAKLS